MEKAIIFCTIVFLMLFVAAAAYPTYFHIKHLVAERREAKRIAKEGKGK